MTIPGKIYTILVHLVFWTCLLIAINIVFSITIRRDIQVGDRVEPLVFEIKIIKVLLLGLVFKMLLFYENVYILLKRFLARRSLAEYLFLLAISAIVIFALEQALIDFYYRLTRRITNGDIRRYLIKVNILLYLFIIVASSVTFFISEYLKVERAKNKLTEEHLKTELELLRYQLNPHFLFNTLNNLFGMAQKRNDPEMSDGILKLSRIMRYILYETNEPLIAVNKEIEYLNSYIDICKLRIHPTDDVSITLNVTGDTEEKKVMPILFMPLVENAIKHGINFKKRSFINMHLLTENKKLIFTIENSNHSVANKSNVELSGIGLTNLKKRLELMYGDRYTCHVRSTDAVYSATLTIPV